MPDVQELLVNLRFTETGSGLAETKAQLAATEAQAAKTTSAFGSLGNAVKGFALGLAGLQATSTTIEFLKGSIQAAAELEAAETRLNASLKANVSAFDGSTAAIDAASAAGERLGFDNVELIDSFSRIVAATHDVNRALQIQTAAEDLARFKRVDLATATDALVHIEAGRYRGLADLGIVLKAGATQTEALAAVEKVAAGQAVAFGATAEGAMARASVAVQNLQEKIGKGLLPVIGDAADAFTKFLNEPTPGGPEGGLNVGLGPITTAFTGLTEVIGAFKTAFAQSPLGRFANELGAIHVELVGTAQGLDESARSALTMSEDIHTAALAAAELALRANEGARGSKALAGDIGETDVRLGSFKTAADDAAAALAAMDLAGRNLAARLNGPVNSALAGTADNLRAFSGLPSEGDQSALDARSRAFQQTADYNAQQQALRDKAAADALTAAKKAAAEYAATLRDNLNVQLSNAKDIATRLFDALHARHLQAINDVETLAQKNRDATTQQIADDLRLRLARDAAPVTAAEKAQSDIEISRQNRDLHAALASAQQGGDPLAIRQAQEALQSFQAQQHLNYLKEQQAIHDLAAQAQAAAAQKAADDLLVAAKTAQAAAIKAETDRNRTQLDDFDRALAALKKRDEGASPSKVRSDISALERRFGIVTDPSGFHHIEDPLVTAIKNVKIPTPVINQTFHFTLPAISISGRQIVAAQSLTLSPSSASSVRVGNLKPIG